MDKPRDHDSTEQRIVFPSDKDLTFVNYDHRQDYAYRRAARLHNAHRRTQTARKHGSQLSKKDTSTNSQPRQIDASRSIATTVSDRSTLLTNTTFSWQVTNAQFINDDEEVNKEWRTIFPEHFFLPGRLNTSLQQPQDAFWEAAKQDARIYRALVLLPVITSRARRGERTDETVYYLQAQLLRDFRQMAQEYTRPSSELTREDFQRYMATTFAFHLHDFQKASAYDAIMYSNATVFLKPENRAVRQLPAVEWIRTIMPLPGSHFRQSRAYRAEMLIKIGMLLDFLTETRTLIESRGITNFAPKLLPGKTLYKILTLEIPDAKLAEPYTGFYSTCQHRVLFLINALLNQIDRGLIDHAEAIFTDLEQVAEQSLREVFPYNLTSFLWYMLVLGDGQKQTLDVREPLVSWCIRELVKVHNLSVSKHMLWLLQIRVGIEPLTACPPSDLDEIRQEMEKFYLLDERAND